jgi:hypothetical protein
MTSTLKLCTVIATLAALVAAPLEGAPKKGGAKLVPFKGRFAGAADSSSTTAIDSETNLEVTTTVVTIEGGGNGTHLGRYRLAAALTSSSDSAETASSLVFTAANGDEVWAEFSAASETAPDGLVDSELTATITGGTGRFANSTGYFTLVMTSDPDTGKSTGSYTGKISGPGKGN